MHKVRSTFHLWVLVILFISVLAVWYAILRESNDDLVVSFLNVGQGDAIFIKAPNGNQILIDGGQNNAVLRELSKVMPFYDRSIDVVLATHPDSDHIGGLSSVLDRYDVSLFLETEARADTPAFLSLRKAVLSEMEEKGMKYLNPRAGQVIWLDKETRLVVLFPDRSTDGFETNTASIVAKLVHGDSSFMLTGDAPSSIENYLVSVYGKNLASTVLKAGHHGSKTSSSEIFVGFVSPRYAVISAGKDNSYGHPHKQVLDIFNKLNAMPLSTIEGRVTFVSDGISLKYKE
ncbi:MAG: MBL fold metallo-hydrolase [bacterium]|nr:MBL fold metallo-hydrolase [bacterium]